MWRASTNLTMASTPPYATFLTFHRQNTMHHRSRLLFLGLVALSSMAACRKEVTPVTDSPLNLPATPFDYVGVMLPDYLRQPGPGGIIAANQDNTPGSNPITNHGATLGRVLFYDRNLSQNRTVACASCHKQEHGFSDPAVLSKGFEGGNTGRHSMGLINARWYARGRFFWDERATTLENQVLMPFQDPVEMGMTLSEVTQRVQQHSYYAGLFRNAFGSEEVNSERISRALAQFVRSIVSVNSRYDEGRAQVANQGDPFPNFTNSENNGKRLFLLPPNAGGLGCAGCHNTDAFLNAPGGPTNNGLDAETGGDQGAFGPTQNPALLGAFKVPSLKSIAETAPYMHDGRFATLEQVIEHYNSGVQNHPNLAPQLRDPQGNPRRLNLSAQQKADLLAFLKTLSDPVLAGDVKFGNPFR
jgi:cytochrome c peroxidase